VLRGPSISDLILSPTAIDYAGMTTPSVILALAEEGVTRRAKLFGSLGPETLVIRAAGLALPETRAQVQDVNFKAQGLKSVDWALAALAVMSRLNRVISPEMLDGALAARFKGDVLASSRSLVAGVTI
jgi:hypothetical protein